ncbi:MAG TPA: aldolase [Roseomonas sp.]
MPFHGGCAARRGEGVLLLGPPGSGKSDLLLRLLGHGWTLVADDQVEVVAHGGSGLVACAPPALSGLLEVRGVGIQEGVPVTTQVPLRLVARLVTRADVPRLPGAAAWTHAGRTLPALALDPFAASAPAKLELALDVVLGKARLSSGFR